MTKATCKAWRARQKKDPQFLIAERARFAIYRAKNRHRIRAAANDKNARVATIEKRLKKAHIRTSGISVVTRYELFNDTTVFRRRAKTPTAFLKLEAIATQLIAGKITTEKAAERAKEALEP